MKKVIATLGAAALFINSSAWAFCINEKAFQPNASGFDIVACSAQNDSGNMVVNNSLTDIRDYTYHVQADGNVESTAGGALLDRTGSVVIGLRGPCNESFSRAGGARSRVFFCDDASPAIVRFIRVFFE